MTRISSTVLSRREGRHRRRAASSSKAKTTALVRRLESPRTGALSGGSGSACGGTRCGPVAMRPPPIRAGTSTNSRTRRPRPSDEADGDEPLRDMPWREGGFVSGALRRFHLRPWPAAGTILLVGLAIRESFSFWTGHPFDFEIWIRTGYVVAHGTNPYLSAAWPPVPGSFAY